jgi:hypothetical protein
MDATIAISEPGVNVVMQKALTFANASKSDTGSWGPFEVGYAASVALSGGVATLVNAPANKLDLSGVHVAGSLSAHFTFDLGKILPTICIPPFKVCVHIPFVGTFCSPQICIPMPIINVPVTLPFAFDLDVSFGFQVNNLGSQWGIDLLIDPFSPRFDLTPMGPAIIAAIQAEVSAKLGSIPLIGGLIAGLINIVIGAFTPLLSGIFGAFGVLINLVLSLLDLLNVSIPFNLLKFDKQQTFIPANIPLIGDAPVKMVLAALQANVLDRELVAEGALA